MFYRLINPLESNSFFIFGARGTGKSTFLKKFFAEQDVLWVDLLDPQQEDLFSRNPTELKSRILSGMDRIQWVVIDEIQKVPHLLNLAHQMIESHRIKFAMTGSSARKLRRGSANLLAGRAFVNELYPLTHLEMGDAFDLNSALLWGTLPKVASLQTDEERSEFLKSYALTYLKEEIWAEQIIRNLDPFRKFLEVAAQTSGEIVNFSNIARDVGADTKTVQSYFQILEDTLIGTLLEPYHRSVRKRQRQNPKFYFFDEGVRAGLARQLVRDLHPSTYGFGKAFERFVILETMRLNSYLRKDYRFFYLTTKDDTEIDLVIERPGLKTALVEIKSTDAVDERDTRTVERFLKDFDVCDAFVLSRDPHPKRIGEVDCLPWQEGLKELGLGSE